MFDILLALLNNTGNVVNEGIKAFQGNLGLMGGAAVLIVAAFFILYVLKNFVANAVVGVIALLLLTFVFGVPIPLSPFVILISVLGGVGGVAAVLIGVFFGWL